MSLAIILHLLAAIVWVGGMFFAHQVLRPVAAEQLAPPERLRLWSGVFPRFFMWVWLAVALLPLTGYWMLFTVFGGMAGAALYIHAMQGLGLVMIAIYVWLFFGPYRKLQAAVAAEDWPTGGAQLAIIRKTVGVNLILGLAASALGGGGRHLMALLA